MRGRILAVSLAAAIAAGPVGAADTGSPPEAKAMLAKAVEHYKSAGRKQALADFTAKKPPFSDRDLYVFCIGANHVIVANGGYPKFVGASADILQDADGKPLGKALVDAGSRGGSVEYSHINPLTHKRQQKVSFVQKAGDDTCGVGAYR